MRCLLILFSALVACGNSHNNRKRSGPSDAAKSAPTRSTSVNPKTKQPKPASAKPKTALAKPKAGPVKPKAPVKEIPTHKAANMTWRNMTIDTLRISLDVFAGDGVEPLALSEDGLRQQRGDTVIKVAWGADVGIDAWKRIAGALPGQTISAVTATRMCGKAARTVTVKVPDRGTIRGKHFRHRMPAYTLTMVEVRLGKRVVLFSVFVEPKDEAAYAKARAHFFASVKCK